MFFFLSFFCFVFQIKFGLLYFSVDKRQKKLFHKILKIYSRYIFFNFNLKMTTSSSKFLCLKCVQTFPNLKIIAYFEDIQKLENSFGCSEIERSQM